MKFLVQRINNKTVHDFVFALERAKDFARWRGESLAIRYLNDVNLLGTTVRSSWHSYIPVGSVGFVSAYLRTFYPEAVRALVPLNIPKSLRGYAGRPVRDVLTPDDMPTIGEGVEVFRKSLTTIKDETNGFLTRPVFGDCRGYQISPRIKMLSEWRAFVFNGQILDLRCYAGDFFLHPDPDIVRGMVRDYADAPVAYTLDVAVVPGGKTPSPCLEVCTSIILTTTRSATIRRIVLSGLCRASLTGDGPRCILNSAYGASVTG